MPLFDKTLETRNTDANGNFTTQSDLSVEIEALEQIKGHERFAVRANK